MEEIRNDFAPAALAAAVKNNLYAYFVHLPPSEHIVMQAGKGWQAWRTPVPHPWFNGVLVHVPAAEMDEVAIEASLQPFADYAGMIAWWPAAQVAVDPWRARLAARGFGYEADTPGMAIDLAELNQPAAPVGGLEIRRVASAQDLQVWGEVFTAGYELPPAWHASCIVFFRELGHELPIRNYLGLLAGEPVATASLFLGAGVAGVMNISTLPAARRRGIGAAMTLAALVDGRDLGCRIGVLQSSDQGYPVYRRMGFVEVCKMEHFSRRAPLTMVA